MVISQSGETADTLAALRLCKERGVRTIGIVNVVGSSIAREADATMYTWAGPEISVATTKAYSTQLAACYLLATEFARVRGTLADGRYEHLSPSWRLCPRRSKRPWPTRSVSSGLPASTQTPRMPSSLAAASTTPSRSRAV